MKMRDAQPFLMRGTRSLRRSAQPKRRRTLGLTGGYDDQAAPLSTAQASPQLPVRFLPSIRPNVIELNELIGMS